MNKIKLLDKQVVQKIAAGEVVERPASIVKELIENSLDANAKNITIEIKDGGKSFIRVTDDGDGINDKDVELAFTRHSTSKLSNINDLYNIMTLGFRGEALASIASISKVELLTKTSGANAGIHVFIEEGQIKNIEKVGSAKGTTMIIKDIFYNLPVRKKFLRSDVDEGNSISDIVSKIALGNYNTSFKLIKDNRIALDSKSAGNLKENIYTILGKDIVKEMILIDYDDSYIKVHGYISNNNLYRSNRNHQYLYLNGRYITNYQLSNAIERNYTTNIPSNKHPIFVLFLNINPNEIDVNIHPTKQEVKFGDINRVYDVIYELIRNNLNKSLSSYKIKSNEVPTKQNELPRLFDFKETFKTEELIIQDLATNDNNNNIPIENINFVDFKVKESNIEDIDFSLASDTSVHMDPKTSLLEQIKESRIIGSFFNTYILFENNSRDYIYIIDQHAAHERIMYERIKSEYEKESVNIQKLLAPEVFELTNKEFNVVFEHIDIFNKLGFEISEFGHNTIQIRGVPLVFGKPNIRHLFLEILDNIDNNIKSNYEVKLDRIMKLSCTNAVKSGDYLEDIEIDTLVKDLVVCDNPFNCPHGRPTIIEISKNEIEKQFLRT